MNTSIFFASLSLSVLNRIKDFVKNHKPKIAANKAANNDSFRSQVKLKKGKTESGIKKV